MGSVLRHGRGCLPAVAYSPTGGQADRWVYYEWVSGLVWMKQLNVHLTDEEHAALYRVKDDRTWKEAIKQEFGVSVDE